MQLSNHEKSNRLNCQILRRFGANMSMMITNIQIKIQLQDHQRTFWSCLHRQEHNQHNICGHILWTLKLNVGYTLGQRRRQTWDHCLFSDRANIDTEKLLDQDETNRRLQFWLTIFTRWQQPQFIKGVYYMMVETITARDYEDLKDGTNAKLCYPIVNSRWVH